MSIEIDKELQRRLAGSLKGVIDQQIAEKNPPETLEAFERLQDEGFTKKEAYDLIGMIISHETAEIISTGEEFNGPRFAHALGNLPRPYTEPRKKDPDDE